MKKIFILLLCLFSVPVYALEYSDYTDFSDYQEVKVEKDDLTDVKIERRYKFYKYNKTLGPYESKEIKNNNFPYIDNNDYIYTSESEQSLEMPEEKDDRIILNHDVYYCQKLEKLNYIKIRNFTDFGYVIKINNLNVIYDGKQIDYDVEYNNATLEEIKHMGGITLRFKENLDIEKLSITLDTSANQDKTGTLIIEGGNDLKQLTFITHNINNNDHWVWNGNNVPVNSSAFEYVYLKEGEYIQDTQYVKLIEKKVFYSYKDILYHKYNLEKEYYPYYLKNSFGDYIFKDNENYKDYYAYRTRMIINNFNNKKNDNLNKIDLLNNDVIIITSFNEEKKDKELNSIDNLLETGNYNSLNNLKNNVNKNYHKKLFSKRIKKQMTYDFITPFILSLVILILVLSKLYKNKK